VCDVSSRKFSACRVTCFVSSVKISGDRNHRSDHQLRRGGGSEGGISGILLTTTIAVLSVARARLTCKLKSPCHLRRTQPTPPALHCTTSSSPAPARKSCKSQRHLQVQASRLRTARGEGSGSSSSSTRNPSKQPPSLSSSPSPPFS
jgi:hypothetical protein